VTDWYVYIVSNNSHTLYTGMTNDLPNRVRQHKDRTHENAFTARYTFDRLVWFETQPSKSAAAKRERRIQSVDSREACRIDSGDESELDRSTQDVDGARVRDAPLMPRQIYPERSEGSMAASPESAIRSGAAADASLAFGIN